MKSYLLIQLLFLQCNSQFSYPLLNDILYTDTTYNITWNDSSINDSNLHIFLTNNIDNIHNNITISNYNNGSAILSSFIGNESAYEWYVPYELNKYNINIHNFKLLLSNTSTPFVYTLGNPNFLYYYSDYFKIYSNLNITHPTLNQIITPNNSFISYQGFKNNLTLSFLYNPTNTFQNIPNINYDVINNQLPFNFDYHYLNSYSSYPIKAKLREANTNIELLSPQFNIIGINITTLQSVYLNPSNIFLTWINYNYNGSNNIEVYYQGSLLESFLITNETYDLNVSNYTTGLYNISISNNLYPTIYDFIEVNILFTSTSTTQTDTTTTQTDTTTTQTDTTTTQTDTTTTQTDTTTTQTDTTTTQTNTYTITDTTTTVTNASCLVCTTTDSENTEKKDLHYIYIVIIIASIAFLLLICYIYYKCKQLKTRHIERKISPQEKVELETISYRNNYAGTGFIDTNAHDYNHLRQSRIAINNNYENADCNTSTSTSSSISYYVNSNTYQEAIPYYRNNMPPDE